MREIVLDTETTGLDPTAGHRVVEIGCVELLNHLPTGVIFHCHINPERDMPPEAFAVHGLSEEYLSTQPVFAEKAGDLIEFLSDSKLIIHNAEFDMKFLNWELKRLGFEPLPKDRAIDTVAMARRKFPGSPASLDALCRRFSIDNSARTKHGALLDAELLAEVYLELIGGREPGLALTDKGKAMNAAAASAKPQVYRAPRPHVPSEAELRAWEQFVGGLSKPIWLN